MLIPDWEPIECTAADIQNGDFVRFHDDTFADRRHLWLVLHKYRNSATDEILLRAGIVEVGSTRIIIADKDRPATRWPSNRKLPNGDLVT